MNLKKCTYITDLHHLRADDEIYPLADICIIDMADREPHHNDIVLVRLDNNNQPRLLKALDGLAGISLVTDDPRLGVVPIKEALVYGRMVELRRDLKG